jgi:hypothetical protein
LRRAARRDISEPAIIDYLRSAGWSTQSLNIKDGPDQLLGRNGETHLAEIKTGKYKVRPKQTLWHQNWRGATVVILRTVEDAKRFSEGHAR